ncbi:MAG TPA: type II secretion system protein [Candidatus Paceibacterota bacterium]|nr:type II secretion system protein [Candidatus Paceibacterota bacterium]
MHLNASAKGLKSGFTLIEILVVIAISAFLSSFAIIYSKTGQNQVTLSVDEQRIVAAIAKARSLTVTTFKDVAAGQASTCGYGMKINYAANTYSLFSYLPPTGVPAPACNSVVNIDPAQIDQSAAAAKALADYQNLPLDSHIVFNSSPLDSMTYVLFVAPEPRTIVSVSANGNASLNPASVHLQTSNGMSNVTVTVNDAGQVDF